MNGSFEMVWHTVRQKDSCIELRYPPLNEPFIWNVHLKHSYETEWHTDTQTDRHIHTHALSCAILLPMNHSFEMFIWNSVTHRQTDRQTHTHTHTETHVLSCAILLPMNSSFEKVWQTDRHTDSWIKLRYVQLIKK